MRRGPRLISLIVPVAISACGGEGGSGTTSTRSAPDPGAALTRGSEQAKPRRRPTGTRTRKVRPAITMLTPKDQANVPSRRVTVAVSVDRFDVVEQRVRPPFPRPVAGKGHIHFYLDTKKLPTEHGPPATGVYRSLSATTYTWAGVSPGRHRLAVQLVGKDHVPLRPPVMDRVTVDVD